MGLKPNIASHEIPLITDYISKEILKRCGRYLKKIGVKFLLLTDFIYLVAAHFKNIQSIHCTIKLH